MTPGLKEGRPEPAFEPHRKNRRKEMGQASGTAARSNRFMQSRSARSFPSLFLNDGHTTALWAAAEDIPNQPL